MTCSWLRIAVVQFAPKLGEVQANIAKARALCQGLAPRSVDLVCFPEMIFTGYVFPDAPSIAPYLEHPKTGPTASFCAELAKRLECFVVAGFPEQLEDARQCSSPASHGMPTPTPTLGTSAVPSAAPPLPTLPTLMTGANTAAIYDPTGRLAHAYRKSNLFPTDRTWARPGRGFAALDLPAPLGRTAIAICNDLNVRAGEVWTSLHAGPYELADFCVREDVRVLLLLNAWLRPGDGGMEGVEKDGEDRQGGGDAVSDRLGREQRRGDQSAGDGDAVSGLEEEEDGLEPNWEVLNYWAARLWPLWAADDAKKDETSLGEEQRDVVVVVSNRFGRERGKTFVGSSAMFAMRSGSGKPRLMHAMGERKEGVCVWAVRVGSEASSS